MSYDDDNRGYPQNGQPSGRERGAYTPPTGDDDLPFSRSGYDPRRAPAPKSPPLTLIISVLVLLAIIVGIIIAFTFGGSRKEGDVPPATGTQVDIMKVESPMDAQPVDPEQDIRVYRDTATPEGANPTLTPGPEEVLPRPAPKLDAPAPAPVTPPPAPKAVAPTAPAPTAPVTTAPAAPKVETPAAPAPAAGTKRAQFGAFGSRASAQQQYATYAARYSRLVGGASQHIEPVTVGDKTLYRTAFSGLTAERANALCAAIKADGGDCMVR